MTSGGSTWRQAAQDREPLGWARPCRVRGKVTADHEMTCPHWLESWPHKRVNTTDRTAAANINAKQAPAGATAIQQWVNPTSPAWALQTKQRVRVTLFMKMPIRNPMSKNKIRSAPHCFLNKIKVDYNKNMCGFILLETIKIKRMPLNINAIKHKSTSI